MDRHSLWKTISENAVYDLVKYGAVAAGALVIAATTYLVHRWLPTHDVIAASIVLAVALAAFVLFAAQIGKGKGKANTTEVIQSQPSQVSSVTLRARAFALCDELAKFIAKRGKRPDENEIFNDTHLLGGAAFEKRYKEEVLPWDELIQAGYLLNFKDQVVRLRHEMVLAGFVDDGLDKAISEADRVPDSAYEKGLRTIVEKIRVLASKMDA